MPTGSRRREAWTSLPDGRWIERIVSTNNGSTDYPAGTNRYVWDGDVLLAVLDHTNGLVMSFLRGLDLSGTIQGAGGVGGVLAVTFRTNGTHFVAYDGNGNVATLTDASTGGNSAVFEYGPFGEPLRVTGPAAAAMPLRFSTMYEDEVTGDRKYRFREYRPSLGCWLSRDPVEEKSGLHLYAFVLNDPINDFDLYGLWTKEGVLRYLCCCRRWVVDDCLAKKTVISFDEIKVTYDKYEKKNNGKKGKYLGKHEYYLAGKNDGSIWVDNTLSDGDAAATLLHECEHDSITAPSAVEEEVQVRIAEEWFRIQMGLPEAEPGFRTAISLCIVPLSLTVPNQEAITKWVERAYAHRNPDSPFIFENRKEEVKGKKLVSGWKCPDAAQ